MKFFYARVSLATQNLDIQIKLFKEMGAHDRDIFVEKKSGKSFDDREEWKTLYDRLIPGDVVVIKSLDRLGRNTKEIREVLIELANNKIFIESIDQGYLNDFLRNKLINRKSDSLAEAMINTMLDTMLEVDLLRAEWERKKIKKRQKEGVLRAIEKGFKFGKTKNDTFRNKFKELYLLTRNKDDNDYLPVKKTLKLLAVLKLCFIKWKKN